jgi:hypothetical protein
MDEPRAANGSDRLRSPGVGSARTAPWPEWARDLKFNAAEDLLRDPSLKDVIKAAIDKGVEVVTWKK